MIMIPKIGGIQAPIALHPLLQVTTWFPIKFGLMLEQ
jgi:hypothetical protein